MPKLSIIIPSYNVEKFIVKCLESIKTQTLTDFEVIIIDDSFEDNTRHLITTFIKSDSRFSLINLEKKITVSEKRNIGIEKSSGDYVIFIDSDDYCEPTLLETAYTQAINDDLDIVIFNFNQVDDSYSFISTSQLPLINQSIYIKKNNLIELYMKYWLSVGPMYYSWNKIFKASTIKNNNLLFSKYVYISEDMLFNSLVFMNSNKIGFIEDSLYNYVRHNNSITKKIGNTDLITFGFYHIYETLIMSFHQAGSKKLELLKPILLIKCMSHAMGHLKRNVGDSYEEIDKYYDIVLSDIVLEDVFSDDQVYQSIEFYLNIKDGEDIHSAESYLDFYTALKKRNGAMGERQRSLNG